MSYLGYDIKKVTRQEIIRVALYRHNRNEAINNIENNEKDLEYIRSLSLSLKERMFFKLLEDIVRDSVIESLQGHDKACGMSVKNISIHTMIKLLEDGVTI